MFDATAYVALVERMKEVLRADRCTLYVVDSASREVRSLVALGLTGEGIRLPIHRGLVGFVARTGQTLNLRDAYNDPRFDRSVDKATGYRTKAALTMAVRDQDKRIVGVLQALNAAAGTFSPADETTMQVFCVEAVDLFAAAAATGA